MRSTMATGWAFVVWALLALAACAGEKGDVGNKGDSALLQVVVEPAGANCPTGGQRVSAAVGQSASITTSYVCNGEAGAAAIVTVADEPPGANCDAGGARLTTSVGGGVPTISFVCNGRDGLTAVAEAAGANCPAGGLKVTDASGAPQYVCNGQNGLDGQGVTVTAQEPGSECAAGGVKLQVGSGSPSYVCNGAGGQLLAVGAGPDQTVRESIASVTLSGTTAAAEQVQWRQLSGPPVTLLGSGAPTATFTPPNVVRDELLLFRLTAHSGSATQSADTVVRITFENAPPVVTVPAPFAVPGGTEVALSGLGADSDGQPLAYTWVQTAGPTVVLRGASQPTLHFGAPSAPAATTLGFTLTVSDGSASASAAATVTVNALGVGPVVGVVPDLSATADVAFAFQIVATDANPGDSLRYRLTPGTPALPAWAYLNPSTGTLTGTPRADLGAVSGLRVRVTDGEGHFTDSNLFTLQAHPGVPARLRLGTPPPSHALPGAVWPPFTVRVEDTYGNLVTADDSTWVRVANVQRPCRTGPWRRVPGAESRPSTAWQALRRWGSISRPPVGPAPPPGA